MTFTNNKTVEQMSLSEKVNECLKMQFEEIAIWKASKDRNTAFARENIKYAEEGIRAMADIQRKLNTT